MKKHILYTNKETERSGRESPQDVVRRRAAARARPLPPVAAALRTLPSALSEHRLPAQTPRARKQGLRKALEGYWTGFAPTGSASRTVPTFRRAAQASAARTPTSPPVLLEVLVKVLRLSPVRVS